MTSKRSIQYENKRESWMHLTAHLKKKINYFRKKPKTISFHNTIMHGTSYYAVSEILWIKLGSLLPWLFYIWYCQSNKTYAYTASALQDFQCMHFLIQTKKPIIRLIHILHTEYPCAAATEIMLNLAWRGHVCRKVPRFLSVLCSRKAFKSRLIIAGHVSEEWRMKVSAYKLKR